MIHQQSAYGQLNYPASQQPQVYSSQADHPRQEQFSSQQFSQQGYLPNVVEYPLQRAYTSHGQSSQAGGQSPQEARSSSGGYPSQESYPPRGGYPPQGGHQSYGSFPMQQTYPPQGVSAERYYAQQATGATSQNPHTAHDYPLETAHPSLHTPGHPPMSLQAPYPAGHSSLRNYPVSQPYPTQGYPAQHSHHPASTNVSYGSQQHPPPQPPPSYPSRSEQRDVSDGSNNIINPVDNHIRLNIFPHLTPTQLVNIATAFIEIDQDRSGYIDRKEIYGFMRISGKEADPIELEEAMKKMDINKDGLVSWSEYFNFMVSVAQPETIHM